MVQGGVKIFPGSQLGEFEACLLDHRLKQGIRRQCYPVPALPQADAQTHEGMNIAVASEGDQEVVHGVKL
jgi:hypothetical protein